MRSRSRRNKVRVRRPREQRINVEDKLLLKLIKGAVSPSGIEVNSETVFQSTAVISAVSLIADTIAALPLIVYKKETVNGETVKRRAESHPYYKILHDSPNEWMTSFNWRETVLQHFLLEGNAYTQIIRSGSGRAIELIPIEPHRVTPKLEIDPENPKRRILLYEISMDEQDPIIEESKNILHFRSLSWNAFEGRSRREMASGAFGLGIGGERFANTFFGNNAQPRAVLKYPGRLKDESFEKFRERWNAQYQGLENQNKMGILENGMDIQTFGFNLRDSQAVESRTFQLQEQGRVFRVQPHFMGDLSKASFNNIEQQSLEFKQFTNLPIVKRMEQEINLKLFRDSDHFAEFLLDSLARADMKDRFESYNLARNAGFMSINDIRKLENMDPIENGDDYLQPLNMVPVGSDVEGGDNEPEQDLEPTEELIRPGDTDPGDE